MDRISDIEIALIDYFARNPLAGDTVPGITRWWLGLEIDDQSKVEQSLKELEQQGLTRSQTASDGQVHWRSALNEADP